MMKLARFFDNFFGGINAINNNITTGIKYLPCTPSVTYLPTGVHWKFIPRITNINTKSDKNNDIENKIENTEQNTEVPGNTENTETNTEITNNTESNKNNETFQGKNNITNTENENYEVGSNIESDND